MKIVIVAEVYLPKTDGVVIRTMNLIRELMDAGDEVLVVCPEVEGAATSPVPTVSFRSFPLPSYPEYRIGIPDKSLADALRRFQPDVIHYLNPFAFGFRCCDLIRRTLPEIPALFSFHTLYGEFVKQYGALKPLSHLLWWLMREYHNSAGVNLTVSSVMEDDLRRRGFQRVSLWPPAVDSTLFNPGRSSLEMRDRLSGGHPEKPLLLTVSRLAPEKNVGFLADVLSGLGDVRLAVVGDGPSRAGLEKKFGQLPAQFHGYLHGEELAAAYASADVFLYASETETMGNVILESMASGTPVCAARAGGIPGLVSHGTTGMLYEPGDVGQAVEYANCLLTEQDFRSELEMAARIDAQGRSWPNAVKSVREDYVRAVEDKQTSDGRHRRRRPLAGITASALVMGFRTAAVVHRQVARKTVRQVAGS